MDLFSAAVVKRYQDILKSIPYSTAFCPLAQIYRMQKELDSAEELCLKGLQYNPRHWAGHIALAQIYKDRGNPQKALEYLSKARSIDPENPRTYELLGEIYREKGDMESSLAAFKMVLFLHPWSQFAAQMVKQLENKMPSSKTEKEKKKNVTSVEFSRRRKLKKLQKLLSHVEKLIAAT